MCHTHRRHVKDNYHYSLTSEDRIRNGIKKLLKSKQGSTQGRLDSFFKAAPSPKAGIKRKVCDMSLDVLLKALLSLFFSLSLTSFLFTL